MPAHFVYGLQEGRYTHVRDLDPDSERGRACDCACPVCKRPLLAHMGDVKTRHFQHVAEDVSCNPQPMTLLHAFVRDRLAEKRQLWLPGGLINVSTDLVGGTWSDTVTIPDKDYIFETAVAKQRVGDIQPDVVFKIPDRWELAIEVRYL